MVTPINLDLHEQFIPHILSDVAERRTDSGEYLPRGRRRRTLVNGQRRRVFVHGDHICYQQEQFHDSDSEHRLSMAMAAGEVVEKARLGQSRGSNLKASRQIALALLSSSCERLKARFLKSSPSTPFEPAYFRLAETIRRQVRRYRAKHPNWQRDFEMQVASFRGSHFRDPEWFGGVEERFRQWLAEFEKRHEFEWTEAMRIVSMARMYQDRRIFDHALSLHRKAILIARKALMNESFRHVVLLWLRSSVKACVRKRGLVRDPAYVGPRLANQ